MAEGDMRLNTIKPAAGSKREHLRVGRGASAGQGKTCGRGVKGQRARKGGYHKVGFEGGQMPLQRRLPKFGFLAPNRKHFAVVHLEDLGHFQAGSTVDEVALRARGLVKGRWDGVKLLSGGALRGLKSHGDHQSNRCFRRHDALCRDAQASDVPIGCAGGVPHRCAHSCARN